MGFMEIYITLGILGVLLLGLFIIWLFRLPVPPDPWDGKVDEDKLENESEPLCLNCLKPVKNPGQHYCPDCGNVTGDFTRYIPFVNIQFNYSIFRSLWKKLNNRKTNFFVRIIYFILIMALAPVMLLVGLPVRIYRIIKTNLKS